MKKQDLVDLLMANEAIAEEHTAADLMKEKKAVLEAMVEQHEGDEIDGVTGSRVRQQYRDKYAKNATKHNRKATTFEGRATLNNGDQLALLLERLSPAEVCALCDDMTEQSTGTTLAKYSHLNFGMQRMNAGNRIRAIIKREDNEFTVEDAHEITSELIGRRPEASE